MKLPPAALILVFPLALIGREVAPGDHLEEVRRVLGQPRGQAESGDRLLLYFDRGEVELQRGAVIRVNLLTPEEHAALTAQRSAESVRAREAAEIRRERQITEGEALKSSQLGSAAFQSLAPAVQLAFWEDFSRRYPAVPCAVELALARQRVAELRDAERRRREQEERLAELEARVVETEARLAATREFSHRRDYHPLRGYADYRRPFSLWPIDYGSIDLTTPWATSTGTPWATPLPAPLENEYRLAPATQRRLQAQREAALNEAQRDRHDGPGFPRFRGHGRRN